MYIIKYLYQTRRGEYENFIPTYYFESKEEAENAANEIWEQAADRGEILIETTILLLIKYH